MMYVCCCEAGTISKLTSVDDRNERDEMKSMVSIASLEIPPKGFKTTKWMRSN